MKSDNFPSTLPENILAALAIALTVLFSWALRPWYSRWGATPSELKKTLPGDELVPEPVIQSTRAITIQAPPEFVWPWLAQIGHGRGGLYSYELLENFAGCDIHNAGRIVPEWQNPQVGDWIGYGPKKKGYPGVRVQAIEPGRFLLLGNGISPEETGPAATTWLMVLEKQDGERTRLIFRDRLSYTPGFASFLMWRVFTDPIAFIMGRKMMLGIRTRAESLVRQPQLQVVP